MEVGFFDLLNPGAGIISLLSIVCLLILASVFYLNSISLSIMLSIVGLIITMLYSLTVINEGIFLNSRIRAVTNYDIEARHNGMTLRSEFSAILEGLRKASDSGKKARNAYFSDKSTLNEILSINPRRVVSLRDLDYALIVGVINNCIDNPDKNKEILNNYPMLRSEAIDYALSNIGKEGYVVKSYYCTRKYVDAVFKIKTH